MRIIFTSDMTKPLRVLLIEDSERESMIQGVMDAGASHFVLEDQMPGVVAAIDQRMQGRS